MYVSTTYLGRIIFLFLDFEVENLVNLPYVIQEWLLYMISDGTDLIFFDMYNVLHLINLQYVIQKWLL